MSPVLNSSHPAGRENQRASRPAAFSARLGTSPRKGMDFSVGAMSRLMSLNVFIPKPSEKALLDFVSPGGLIGLNMLMLQDDIPSMRR